MMPNEETLKKFFGDPRDEAPEALYRLAATGFVKSVAPTAIDSIVKDSRFKTYLEEHEQIGEFFVGVILAAILELLPLEGVDDERKRLAYNLRVRSYEEVGELGAGYIDLSALRPLKGFIVERAERAIRKAKGDLIEEDAERDGRLDNRRPKVTPPNRARRRTTAGRGKGRTKQL